MNIKSLNLQYKLFTVNFTEVMQSHKFGEFNETHSEVVIWKHIYIILPVQGR